MNILDLKAGFAILVLSAGLISCSKEEKSADSYRSAPVISNGKTSQGLLEWSRTSDRTLDLQSSFDASVSRPARLEAAADCRRGQQRYQESFAFTAPGAIRIFQILPQELLTVDMRTEKIDCAFEITLFNEVGSRHIVNLSALQITDTQSPGLQLEKNDQEPVTRLQVQKLEGVRARYKNTAAAAAQIFCQDMALAEMPFEQVIELIHFDFSKPNLHQGSHAEILQENPLQACRMLVRQGGLVQQLSPRFLLQLPRKPLVIQINPLQMPVDERIQLSHGSGSPFPAGYVTVTNPDANFPRVLRIDKAPGENTTTLFLPASATNPQSRQDQKAVYQRQWLYGTPQASAQIEEKADHWKITLPGGTQAVIDLQIRPPGGLHCAGGTPIWAHNMMVSMNYPIHELSVDDEIINTTIALSNPVVYAYNISRERIEAAQIPRIPCAW